VSTLSSNSSDNVSADAGTSMNTSTATMCCKLIPNELLYFVNGNHINHPESLIRTTVLNFDREDDIIAAKQLVLHAADDIGDMEIQAYLLCNPAFCAAKRNKPLLLLLLTTVFGGYFHIAGEKALALCSSFVNLYQCTFCSPMHLVGEDASIK